MPSSYMHFSEFSFVFLAPLRLAKLATSTGNTLCIKIAKWLSSLVELIKSVRSYVP